MFKKLFQYDSQNLFRFVTVVLGMTDIIKRVWILSAFLWNPPGYTRVVFVVFLIWLEWAEALDFPHLSLGYIWLAKSKYQANYFEKTMFLKWKVVGVLKNGWCCLEIYAKSGGGGAGGVRRFFLCHNKIYLIPNKTL